MKLSIIVPVYNAERYLNNTIENILEQTYTDFELLLIDDGSKDKSGEICDKWSLKDSRVKVVHQQNAGIAGARNTGLDIAQGEYIGFVDNDDFIHPQMYEILLNIAEAENAEIVMSKESKINTDESLSFQEYDLSKIKYGFLEMNDRFRYLFANASEEGPFIHIWNKIYNKQLFSKHRFLDKSMEDGLLNCTIYGEANKFVLLDNDVSLYFWVLRSSSFSHELSTGYYADYIDTYNYLAEYMQGCFPEYAHYSIEKALRVFLSVRYSYRFMKNKKEVNKKIKVAYIRIKKPFLSDKRIKVSHKIIILFFYYCPFVYTLFKIINDPTMIKWEIEQRKKYKT